jgi:hypothetical protein
LLDASSGYKTQLVITKRVKTQGMHFNPEYLSDEVLSPLVPQVARPLEYGVYGLNTKTDGTHIDAITTYGKDDAAANGFTSEVDDNTSIVGHADGYGQYGVLRSRAYVTTCALNAIKINEENQPLGGAQFVIKIKDNASGVTGTPGQDASSDTTIPNGQYLKFDTSNGSVSGVTNKTQATVFTSLSTGVVGKLQVLGLDEDVDYVFEEVQAPPGYQMLNQGLQIPKTNLSQTTYTQDTDDEDLVQIVDLPKVVLPVTGGQSLLIVLVVGAILVLIGVMYKRNTQKQQEVR